MQLPQLITLVSLSAALAAARCKFTFKNGDFDNGKLSPWKKFDSSHGSSVSLHSPGADGTEYAVALYAPAVSMGSGSSDETYVGIIQQYKLCDNTAYTVNFSYAAGSAHQDAYLLVLRDGEDKIYESPPKKSISTNYTHGSGTFNTLHTEHSSNLAFHFYNMGDTPASLYIDSISVSG